MPYQNKFDAMEDMMSRKVPSTAEFDKHMLEVQMQDATEYFYCPLVANVYNCDEYGNVEEYHDEYDGSYLVPCEDRIRDLIRLEDARDEDNLAAYFDGSSGVVGKLKEVYFNTQNADSVLYWCIRAELATSFTVGEEAEFKDWLKVQCSDGYGEGLEQRSIHMEGETFPFSPRRSCIYRCSYARRFLHFFQRYYYRVAKKIQDLFNYKG